MAERLRRGLSHGNSEQVVSVDGQGLHVNHLEGHHLHSGSNYGSMHTYESEEAEAFANFVNSTLSDVEGLGHLLPLDPNSKDIFTKLRDGLILLNLLNRAVPGSVDFKKVNVPKPGHAINVFQMNENLNYFFSVAHSEGCQFVNIGVSDVASGQEIAILSILWQLFRIQLLENISIRNFPGLSALLGAGETLEKFLHHTPEYILLRWMKYHFELVDGEEFPCVNFGHGMKDPYVFNKVLYHLDNTLPFTGKPESTGDADRLERGRQAIANAATLGIQSTTKPSDLLSAASSVKVAFAALIFNTRHGLPEPSAEVVAATKALPDVGRTSNKLTDAQRAEKEAREAAQRQLLQNGVERALLQSDASGAFAKTAEEDADAAQVAATAASNDLAAIRTLLGGDSELLRTMTPISVQARASAESATTHFETCATLAEAIRTKYEDAVTSLSYADAEPTFAAIENESTKAKDEATACHDDRLAAEKAAARLTVGLLEGRARVARSSALDASTTARGHASRAAGLSNQTARPVKQNADGAASAAARAEKALADIDALLKAFSINSAEEAKNAVDRIEQLRLKALDAAMEAERLADVAAAASVEAGAAADARAAEIRAAEAKAAAEARAAAQAKAAAEAEAAAKRKQHHTGTVQVSSSTKVEPVTQQQPISRATEAAAEAGVDIDARPMGNGNNFSLIVPPDEIPPASDADDCWCVPGWKRCWWCCYDEEDTVTCFAGWRRCCPCFF